MEKTHQSFPTEAVRLDIPLKAGIDTLTTDVENQKVLVNISTGDFFETNNSGRIIWTLVEKGLTIDRIVSNLCSRFSVSEKRCRGEVCRFVHDMMNNGLIEYDIK